MPLMVMVKEHSEVWQLLDRLEAELHAGADAASTEDMRNACTQLLASLDRHNSKEEPIIYLRTAVDLDESETEALVDFLATGTMPEGWACAAAR